MKTTLTILAFWLSLSSLGFAQNDYRDPSDDLVNDFSFFLTLGSRPYRLTDSNIHFTYTDESPSADNMVSDKNLRPTNHSFGVKLGFQNMLPRGITIKMMADFYGGQVGGADFDFGAGYTIGRKRFHIRPTAIFSVGGYGLSLGSLEQNGIYIKVNSTEFYSDRVYVKLKAKQFALSPQIEFGYEITDKYEILLCGGYNFGVSSKPYLKFTGNDSSDTYVKEKEPISIHNATILYDGKKLTDTPVGMNGMFIHAGFGFRFAK